MDTEAILALMARLREAMPGERTPLPPPPDDAHPLDVDEFEAQTVIHALQSVSDELEAMVDAAERKLTADALEVYYAAEELARDPAHANLIPVVETMRAAYESDHGRPIPPRAA